MESDPPEILAYLWGWFMELAARRTGSGVGPNPITPAELEAWSRLTDQPLSPYEVRILLRLDDEMLASLRESA